jgi:CRISPR-associated protein Cas2
MQALLPALDSEWRAGVPASLGESLMKQSPFRMGWILVMFDLPVLTDRERKEATRFRNNLLDEGYLMIQFSVYARPCVSYEHLEKHLAKVKVFVPAAGNVRIMFMTDEQWKKSVTVIGKNYQQGKREVEPDIPKQIEFWE